MKDQTRAALTAGTESALHAFGKSAQMIKACEEMGELITQLSKRLNGSPTTDENIIDEIADVTIMATQMALIFGEDAVDERIIFKLTRTMNYIRSKQQVAEPL